MPPKKTRARTIIDGWIEGKDFKTKLLGDGAVFFVPSASEPLPAFYIVCRLGARYWVCSCKGYRFSANDECRHIREVSKAYDEGFTF